MKVLISLLAVVSIASATFQPLGVPFKSPVKVATGFRARVIFSNLTSPGGIAFDDKQNLLAVEIGVGVSAYSQNNAGTKPGWDRTVILKNTNVTQGIQVDGRRLFVSTGKDVLVYTYDSATKSVINTVPPFPIIDGLQADGEFSSHTILLETNSTGAVIGMLVGNGPKENIDLSARDPASGRSQIRRFVFPKIQPDVFPPPPSHWADGQIVAHGLRNPAGFAFPTGPTTGPVDQKVLYVGENGASIEELLGFTPKFANDNPADELNRVTFPIAPTSTSPKPSSYGYPDCTTLWNPTADPDGDPQFVGMTRGEQISLQLADIIDDAWCQKNTNLNHPPSMSFQAHSSPADIKFYTAPKLSNLASFPSSLINDAFVSFFGSFNRSPPTGYGVVHIPFPPSNSTTGTALGYQFLVQAELLNTCPGTCITPDGLAFGDDGRLYVSSTLSGELFLVETSPIVPQ